MKARVTKEFDGRRDSLTYIEHFKAGDIVEGSLAEIAVSGKNAKVIDEEAEAAAAALAQRRADAQAALDATIADLAAAQNALAGAADADKSAAKDTVGAAQKKVDDATAALKTIG